MNDIQTIAAVLRAVSYGIIVIGILLLMMLMDYKNGYTFTVNIKSWGAAAALVLAIIVGIGAWCSVDEKKFES